MGLELEAQPPPLPFSEWDDTDERARLLSRRWQEADERLAFAQAAWRALCVNAPPGDPRLIAAQLKLAQARQRCQDLHLEIGRLEAELEAGADYA